MAGRGPMTQAPRASEAIVDRLRKLIVTLELAPGSVVTETYLCELLGCSRTPLREALQKLASEHLVVATPRRGVSIAELSIIDFGHMLEAIYGLERQIARLAAERIDDDGRSRMTALLTEAEAADGDIARSAELDWEFHHELAAATGNPYLMESSDTLHRLSMRFVFLGFRRAAGATRGALDDHRAIVAALTERDPDAAEKAVAEHCAHGRDRMRAAL